jgi:hypothetical protein
MDQLHIAQDTARWRAVFRPAMTDYLLSVERKYFRDYMKDYPLLNENCALWR